MTAARESERWARVCATVGAAAWAGIAVLARMGTARIGQIELMFLFAPLVIVPLGMELQRELQRMTGVAGFCAEAARRTQPFGAALAVFSICLPPGRAAGLLSLGWMLVCGLMAWSGLVDLVRSLETKDRKVRAALAVARMDLAVGGAWLVASRFGLRPMGIQEPIGLLTAVHFHFAGFATATIAAAMLRFAGVPAHQGQIPPFERREEWGSLRKVMVTAVVVLPVLVAAGFVISPGLKMTAAVFFALSVAALAVFLRADVKHLNDPTARVLLQIASGTVFAGMVFAAAYALADFAGSDALTIPQMARTHGILNAVGFCLPGLLGWLVESTQYSVPRTECLQKSSRRLPRTWPPSLSG